MLFCKLWWNSRRLTLEESRCNKICHGFTFHIPSDYLPLNIIKNAVCSSFWLFYYNFIPEAEHIHDVFSFLSCYRKSSVIYLFQRLDMKKESNEIHNVFYKLSGLYWHVIIPSFHVVIFEHQILCGTVKSEGGMRFIFWAFIFFGLASVFHVKNWTTERKHLPLSWALALLQLCNIVPPFPTLPACRTPSCTPRSRLCLEPKHNLLFKVIKTWMGRHTNI